MIDAETLVDILLDAAVPLLAVFGPKLPKEGYILTADSDDALIDRFLARAGRSVAVDPNKPTKEKANELLNYGYTLIIRPSSGAVYAYTRSDAPIESAQITKYFDVTPDTNVRLGHVYGGTTQAVKAAQLFAGKAPSHDKSEILAFGGVENPPSGTYVQAKVSSAALEKGIESGLRYAIRHPGQRGVIIVTPSPGNENARFTPQELKIIRKKFGINHASTVTWYPGVLSTSSRIKFRDLIKPAAEPQPGLATEPPRELQ